MANAKLVVYKGGKVLFSGKVIDESGGINANIPEAPREFIVSAWQYWKEYYKGDFGRFWDEYIGRRLPTSTVMALSGFSFDVYPSEDGDK